MFTFVACYGDCLFNALSVVKYTIVALHLVLTTYLNRQCRNLIPRPFRCDIHSPDLHVLSVHSFFYPKHYGDRTSLPEGLQQQYQLLVQCGKLNTGKTALHHLILPNIKETP